MQSQCRSLKYFVLLITTSKKIILPADINLLDDSDLVHVEEKPGAVADEEGGHDGHQQHTQVVLSQPAPAEAAPPDNKPDLVIQERDRDEWEHAQHKKPGPYTKYVLS